MERKRNKMSSTRNVTIAALVGNSAMSEAVQRIAFTFGYKWAANIGQKVYSVDSPVLYFNTQDKIIKHGMVARNAGHEAYKVCVTMDQLIDALKNPVNVVQVGNVDVSSDGSVTVKGNEASRHSMNSEEFEQVVEARNKLLGKKVKWPVISFRYHSPTSGLKNRRIALVSEDDTYLSGLDLEDSNLYKQFRKDRLMVGGSILFVGLKEV